MSDLEKLLEDEPEPMLPSILEVARQRSLAHARNALRAELRPLVAALVEERDRLQTLVFDTGWPVPSDGGRWHRAECPIRGGCSAMCKISRAALTGEDKG